MELQTFRLVDADDADAVDLGTLYGLCAQRLVPFVEECGQVGGLF